MAKRIHTKESPRNSNQRTTNISGSAGDSLHPLKNRAAVSSSMHNIFSLYNLQFSQSNISNSEFSKQIESLTKADQTKFNYQHHTR